MLSTQPTGTGAENLLNCIADIIIIIIIIDARNRPYHPWQTNIDVRHLLSTEPPLEQPSVSGVQPRYRPGDILRANCTSHNSKPAANLTWTINDVPHLYRAKSMFDPMAYG
uniref:C2-set_2 domain-containing protein n=1 Tax=Anopheles maculatus TaxID=74869 RepID=A0A182SY96_9DIPT